MSSRLLDAVRALPRPTFPREEARSLIEQAQRHGLGGVLADAWATELSGSESALAHWLASRRIAQELEFAAHVALLGRIDRVLSEAKLRGVVLKGALFAERYYARPSARGSTDVDLLVRESDLADATRALSTVGYRFSDSPREQRFRRTHHHLHLASATALPLELHFHAYRGFGRIMKSEALLQRSVPMAPYESLRVLSPPDELVYLAVHAAAHRFERLSWLYDLKLLVSAMSDAELVLARVRAECIGFLGPLVLAARRLAEDFDVTPARLNALEDERLTRRTKTAFADALAPTPDNAALRAATRFAYTIALSDGVGAALRYAFESSQLRVRDAFERPGLEASGRSGG